MSNIVNAVFDGSRRKAITCPLFQYDYGQILKISGIELPASYQVQFSNTEDAGVSKTMLGDADGVQIPDEYLLTGDYIYAFVYLHETEDDGETEYVIEIPVIRRPVPSEETPTPAEQSLIDQLLAQLNQGVEAAEAAAEQAGQAAETAVEGMIDDTLTIQGKAADAKATGDEITQLKSDLNYQTEIHTIIDRPSLRAKNNSAITDNGDGTYTVGTTDYGNATFYPTYNLPKGEYLLYGVPNGYSWLSTGTSHADAVATNDTNTAKVITIADDTARYTLGYRITAKPSESFVITPFLKRIVSLPDYVINSFDTSKIAWEDGFYYEDGTAGINGKSVRSQTDLFIQVCKGSTIALKNYSDGERLRFCIYANPSEEHFKERITLTNQNGYVFTEDCYVRLYMYYADDRAISDISALTSKAVINILQYVRTTEFVADEGEDIVLPTAWSDKIQTIQEAQGKKFTFVIQTDTHYYDGYGNVAGANLKLLTNYVGFDFVANLGDVIRGYADENIDSDVNMRSAMTEIMHRYITGISCPFMVAMGNHDMNPMWASAFGGEKFSNDEIWGRMFRPSFNTNLKASTQTGMMYYYTDFDDIRVIVLNTQDGTDQGFGIGAGQLDWFTTDALNTQKQVVVLSHVPLVDGWSVGSNYVSSYADIVSALQTFKANGGKVIGCFSGHTHTQENKTVDGILYVTFRNGGNNGEVVMIDLENETINTITVGFSGNRSFTF